MKLSSLVATLDVTAWEGRVRIAERRRLRALRVLGEGALLAGSVALLVRVVVLAATTYALWAVPGALVLVLVVICVARCVTACHEREVVDVVGDTLFAGDVRLRAAAIESIEADDLGLGSVGEDDGMGGVRVTCVGGRALVLFRGYPWRERDAAAQTLRAALGVAALPRDGWETRSRNESGT